MEKKLRVGIIGTGGIAKRHVDAFLKCPDVEIVAASNPTLEKAEKFFESFGMTQVKCYQTHKEMLEKEALDIVSVCSPNRAHASGCIDALNAGIHVLCEKPMSVTFDEAVEMCRAEKASGKILSIGFQPRMSKTMNQIREIVQSGELGQIYYLQAGGGRRHGIPVGRGTSFIREESAGTGAMGDIGCYSLDLLLYAVGYPKPLTVTGMKYDLLGKQPSYYDEHPEYAKIFSVEDFAAGFIRLEDGISLDFRIAWAMHMDTTGDALILGTKGGLKIPSTECWHGGSWSPMTLYKDVDGKRTETVISCEDESMEELFYRKARTFVDAVKNGTPAPVPSREILYNQAIIDGLLRSAELGHEVTIHIPEI